MVIYNKTNKDVAAFLYRSFSAFENGDSIQDIPVVRADLGYTVKANSHKKFKPSDYFFGWGAAYKHWDKNDKYYVAIFESGSTELWKNYVPKNLDELILGIYSTYGGPAAQLPQVQQNVQAIYDLLIDNNKFPGLLGFQGDIRDKDGWMVFWGKDYAAQAGNGTPVFDDPKTTLDTLPHSYSDVPALNKFKNQYYLFCTGINTHNVYVYNASDFKQLDNVERRTIAINDDANNLVRTNKTTDQVTFNDKFYLFYKDNLSSVIHYVYTSNGFNWRMGGEVTASSTDKQPSVAVFNNRLHIVFKQENSHDIFYSSSADGTTWTNPVEVSKANSDVGPSLCVYNNKLYLAFKDYNSYKMYYMTYKGNNKWSDPHHIPNDGTSESPQMLAKGNMLYLAFKGQNSQHLYLKHFDDTYWSDHRKLESSVSAAHFPTMVDSGEFGKLYLAYRESGSDYYPKLAIVKGLIS